MSGDCNSINVTLNGHLQGQGDLLLEDAAKAKNKKSSDTYASSSIHIPKVDPWDVMKFTTSVMN